MLLPRLSAMTSSFPSPLACDVFFLLPLFAIQLPGILLLPPLLGHRAMVPSSPASPFRFPLRFFYALGALLCLAAHATRASDSLNGEADALFAIRESLIDPHDVFRHERSRDPCSWTAVICSSDNVVIGLSAPNKNLSGTLSRRIGDLKNLEQVLLQNNYISGNFPKELSRLKKLQTLDLSNNKLSDMLPRSLQWLTSLRYLDISGNMIGGKLPGILPKSATTINMAENCFNGSIGIVFRQLKDLRVLNISHNFFHSTIGGAFEHLKSLNVL